MFAEIGIRDYDTHVLRVSGGGFLNAGLTHMHLADKRAGTRTERRDVAMKAASVEFVDISQHQGKIRCTSQVIYMDGDRKGRSDGGGRAAI